MPGMPSYLIRTIGGNNAAGLFVSSVEGGQIPNSSWKLTPVQEKAHRFAHSGALRVAAQLNQFGFVTQLQEVSEKNLLWIGGNILFDLETGTSKQILLFVFREEDATTFAKGDADNYLAFISREAARFGTRIAWFIDEASRRPGLWVIRGEQSV
jgi:hypothetical protein